MRLAGLEEEKMAYERNDIKNGKACTKIICDGTWLKSNYHTLFDSNSEVAVIIGWYSDKVLYFGVRNKYCYTCSRANRLKTKIPTHFCFKNWDNSSSSIEQDVIVQGFLCSLEQHGLIYEYMVSTDRINKKIN